MPEEQHGPVAPSALDESIVTAPAPPDRARTIVSRISLILAIALLAGTYFLISPSPGETYPGAIPWSASSILRPLTELLSLDGLLATARGTEIKDFVLYLAAALGLVVLAVRFGWVQPSVFTLRRLAEPWLAAQLLLVGWVVLSALSALWSGDPSLSLGQAALFGLALAWAIAIAWTLEGRDTARLIATLVAVPALAAALCLWYYFERNPAHRPGFPLGNPGTLAASLIPAILLAGTAIPGALSSNRIAQHKPIWPLLAATALALVPLLCCFALTNSRSAIIGLVVGLGTIVFFQTSRRTRWVLVGIVVLGLAGASVYWLNAARFEAALARSETVRFRLYAWRYAAELWNHTWFTSIAGQGAGAYPRLAGQLSIGDRILDPGAFMGELVEHAHNELFEVLTEIGLVGGVTFVAGWLATLAAGAALLRTNLPPERRWLLVGLVASVAALMTDSLLSPNLRLAGQPAIFYTLMGTLLAVCRSAARHSATLTSLLHRAARSRVQQALDPTIACTVAAVLALGAGWLALRNWSGVVREERASQAYARGEFESAIADFRFAEPHLLDPVRQLADQWFALQSQSSAARLAYFAFQSEAAATEPESQSTSTTATPDSLRQLWQTAIARAQDAYRAAELLAERVPTQLRTAGIQATAAELVADLFQAAGSPQQEDWLQRAGQAWRLQRQWRPFDVEALFALLRYPAPIDSRVGLLRDALRSPEGYDRWGVSLSADDVRSRWLQALLQTATQPGFAEAVDQLVAEVRPITAQVDLNTLVISLAPETYRLKAHLEAIQGHFSEAAQLAAEAAALYQTMRPRFPTLRSVALLEQAEFTFSQSPTQAPAAAELLREAIRALPVIQAQKYAELALPYRSRLIICLLAMGQEDQAASMVRASVTSDDAARRTLADAYVGLAQRFIRRPPDQRPPIEPWLRAALRYEPAHPEAWYSLAWLAAQEVDASGVRKTLADALTAGVPRDAVERMRAALHQEFPDLVME